MSESQLKARRATRAKAVLERGEKIFEVEQVEVRSCNGGVAKACGSFLYLGSLTDKRIIWPRDKKEDQEGNGDFQKTLASLGNEGIAFEAKRSSVLGISSLCAFVQ